MPKPKTIKPPRYFTKDALLAAGADVVAVDYARASVDKTGREKSVGEQHVDNGHRIERHGWAWPRSFDDNDESGADEGRQGFAELRRYIEVNAPDVLVLWMVNREARDLEIYAGLRNLCLKNGVCYWLVGTTLFDLREKDDRLNLNIQAVFAETFRDGLIQATVRGMKGAALSGDPTPSICHFGYRRIYDSRTGALVGQEPDDAVPTWAAEDGPWQAEPWTPQEIVQWIFAEARRGRPLLNIARELDRRRIPNPRTFNALQKGFPPVWRKGPNRGKPYTSHWHTSTIRLLLLNPAYLGHRLYHGEIVARECWDALVKPEVFHDVSDLLRNPERLSYRGARIPHHGRARHYFSQLGLCGRSVGTDGETCDQLLRAAKHVDKYRCPIGHVAVPMADLDRFVVKAVLAWLSDPEQLASIAAIDRDDDELVAARTRLAELRSEEAEWDDHARRGLIKASVYAARVADLHKRIEMEEESIRKLSGIPDHVREIMGPMAAQKWAGLALSVRRHVLRTMVEVRVLPVGRGRQVDISERVDLIWFPRR